MLCFNGHLAFVCFRTKVNLLENLLCSSVSRTYISFSFSVSVGEVGTAFWEGKPKLKQHILCPNNTTTRILPDRNSCKNIDRVRQIYVCQHCKFFMINLGGKLPTWEQQNVILVRRKNNFTTVGICLHICPVYTKLISVYRLYILTIFYCICDSVLKIYQNHI